MQNNQLYFLLLFLALSAGSWVVGQLREKAQIKKARDAARRKYEEQLRTGRTEEDVPPTLVASAPSSQDLFQKRQAQLRDLRRQQEQARSAQGRGSTVRQPQQQPSGGQVPRVPQARPDVRTGPDARPKNQPIARGNQPAPARTGTTSPRPIGTEVDSRSDLQRDWQRRRQQELQERDRVQRATGQFEDQQHLEQLRRSQVAAVLAASRAAATAQEERPRNTHAQMQALLGNLNSPESLRRAIIMTEILGKPMSLRDEGSSRQG